MLVLALVVLPRRMTRLEVVQLQQRHLQNNHKRQFGLLRIAYVCDLLPPRFVVGLMAALHLC